MWIRSLCRLFLLHLPLAADSVADTTLGPPTTQVSEEGEWQQLCNRHQVKSWYMEALENLDAFETREEVTELSILRLYEYHDKGRFDRKTSPVRKSIEKDILADIEEVMAKEPQGTPVRLLSLGSEGLLQDWFVVGQLIRQGKTQIDLTIVNQQLLKEPCEEFEKLCKALKSEGISINLPFFPSVEQCAKIQKLPFHCVYAVNYCALLTFKKDTWRNLVSARKIVAPAGHLFVSYLDEILTIDSNGKISVVETWSGNKRLRVSS